MLRYFEIFKTMLLIKEDSIYKSNGHSLTKSNMITNLSEIIDLKNDIVCISNELIVTKDNIYKLQDLSILALVKSSKAHFCNQYTAVYHEEDLIVSCYTHELLFSIKLQDPIINLFVLETPILCIVLVYNDKIELYYEDVLMNQTIVPRLQNCNISCNSSILIINEYLYDLHSLMHVYTFTDIPNIIIYNNILYNCTISNNSLVLQSFKIQFKNNEYAVSLDSPVSSTDLGNIPNDFNIQNHYNNGYLFISHLIPLFNNQPLSDSAIIEDPPSIINQLMLNHNFTNNDSPMLFIEHLFKLTDFDSIFIICKNTNDLDHQRILSLLLSHVKITKSIPAVLEFIINHICSNLEYSLLIHEIELVIHSLPPNTQLQLLRLVRISFTRDLKQHNMPTTNITTDAQLTQFMSLFIHKCHPHPLDDLLLELELFELFKVQIGTKMDSIINILTFLFLHYLMHSSPTNFISIYNNNHLNVYLGIPVDQIIINGINTNDEYLLFIDELMELPLLNSTINKLKEWRIDGTTQNVVLPLDQLEMEIIKSAENEDKMMAFLNGLEKQQDICSSRLPHLLKSINTLSCWDPIPVNSFLTELDQIPNINVSLVYKLLVRINTIHYDHEYLLLMNLLEVAVIYNIQNGFDFSGGLDDLMDSINIQCINENGVYRLHQLMAINTQYSINDIRFNNNDTKYNNYLNNGNIKDALYSLHYGSYIDLEWVESSYLTLMQNMAMNKNYFMKFVKNKTTSQMITLEQLEHQQFTAQELDEMMQYRESKWLIWLHSKFTGTSVASSNLKNVVSEYNYKEYMISRMAVWGHGFHLNGKWLSHVTDVIPLIQCMDNKELGITLYIRKIDELQVLDMDKIRMMGELINFISNCAKSHKIEIAHNKLFKKYMHMQSEYYLEQLHLQNTQMNQDIIMDYWFHHFKRLKTRMQQNTVTIVMGKMILNKMELTHDINVEELGNARYLFGLYLTRGFIQTNANGLFAYFDKIEDIGKLKEYILVKRTQNSGLQLNEDDIIRMNEEDQLITLLEKRQLTQRIMEIE